MAVVSKVVAMKDEGIESLLRRFKKQVMKDEVLIECQKRKYFMSSREKAKWKHDMAIRRMKNKKYKYANAQ